MLTLTVSAALFQLLPTARRTGDQMVNIQASWNLCDVPWELLIPALSVLLEDPSDQEWRGGLEAKYHSAERPRRFNFRRVQVTHPMERSATRFSSPIRLCREALRKSAGWRRPRTKTFHCLLWSAGPGCRQSLRVALSLHCERKVVHHILVLSAVSRICGSCRILILRAARGLVRSGSCPYSFSVPAWRNSLTCVLNRRRRPERLFGCGGWPPSLLFACQLLPKFSVDLALVSSGWVGQIENVVCA